MEYLIAGIRIDIPHRFTTGAFGMALAPFAAENKTETDAGSNRMAGPVPGTATTAAPSPSETPGTERSAPHPATSPADTAQPDLILHTGLLAGDTAGYCELDAFDFTDADADCRFGRDTEGYLLTMTPRDGSAPEGAAEAASAPAADTIPALQGVLACGSPWSGKTPCYRNVSHPIAGIVRLSQAPQNRIRRLRPIEAIGALLPSCPPSFAHDERLEDAICRLVSQIVAQVPVYHLECLPDAAAARLSCRTVFGDDAPNTLR